MSNVIELNHLTKKYTDFLLDDIDILVPKGGICGFIGENGAGKTTTIQLMLGIINKTSGSIKIFDKNMEDDAKNIKEKIGVVFDEMGYHEFLTPKELNNIMKNIYSNWQENAFFEYLKKFSLPATKKCGAFSRGMRMKLQIAVALSHEAELLVMDEPTSGLDPLVRNEMLEIFKEFVEDKKHTVFLSSHITGDLEKISNTVVFIHKGRIVLSGDKNQILSSHGLINVSTEKERTIDKKYIVSSRKYDDKVEVLIKDRTEFKEKHLDIEVCDTTLEEIFIFYAKKD